MMLSPLQLPFVHNPSCNECGHDAEERKDMQKEGLINET